MVSESVARIAYCIPVMNRMSDLKATLAQNLEVVGRFEGQVRLIVACFDRTQECADWIRSEFQAALAEGLLKFRQADPLPHWHFCWAKNAFRDDLSADYYSSLDGDNFLSEEEIERTLAIIDEFPYGVLIHHFSGHWGDGTSGRITVPARLYCEHGYLDGILPRQYDETGLIQGFLAEYPHLTFVSRSGVNIFSARWMREFLVRNGIEPNWITRDLGRVPQPINPRGVDYVEADEKLYYYQNINAAYTGWIHSKNEETSNWFERELRSWQQRFSVHSLCPDCIDHLFTGPGLSSLKKNSEITTYVVNHNNFELLQAWVDHYRSLGVERFVVIDDQSDIPLEDCVAGDDIHVVRPYFGSFRVSKWFWIKALMTAFQEEGSWVLTADIDEFLDLPEGNHDETPLESMILRSLDSDWRSVPGLLIDMMPAPGVENLAQSEALDKMTWHCWRPPSDQCGYKDHHSIQWAFGKLWPISFAVDIRYRLFGTFDCLRKVPLFQYDATVELNQGFHTLGRQGVPGRREKLLAFKKPLLPIRHYKLARLFAGGMDNESGFSRHKNYFRRTQANMHRMKRADLEWLHRLWVATPFKCSYWEAGNQFLELDIEELSVRMGTDENKWRQIFGNSIDMH